MSPVQRYVSRELVHFVGRGRAEAEQYGLLVRILTTGLLMDDPHDPAAAADLTVDKGARISENEMYSPQAVCFADIPIGELGIHIRKYSRFGLSFLRTFLALRGANPVFYVARDCAGPAEVSGTQRRGEYFDAMMREYHDVFDGLSRSGLAGGVDPARLVSLKRFLDFQIFSFVKCFDESRPEDDHENFYMEREWRVLGHVRFELEDVRRVVLPERYARRLRRDVPEYFGQVTFVEGE